MLIFRLEQDGIQAERLAQISDAPPARGSFVLYWMQAAQRAECNHALEYATLRANELAQPLVAVFVLDCAYPNANARHLHFMLQGLSQTCRTLEQRGIQLALRQGNPPDMVAELAQDASLLVFDRGYAPIQRQWRQAVRQQIACPSVEIEGEAIVPVCAASTKEEYSAATIRPKISRQLPRFLVPLKKHGLKRDSLGLKLGSIKPEAISIALGELESKTTAGSNQLTFDLSRVDRSVSLAKSIAGGYEEALGKQRLFIQKKLSAYGSNHNDPSLDAASGLSPYFHFGQISPLAVALGVKQHGGTGTEEFLEQLIVRRELAINFTWHNPSPQDYACLPAWARESLRHHQPDARPYRYSAQQLENAATHDPYWNAAQNELRWRGTMHNYMRMYWGKKILEWSAPPKQAYKTALALNDKYELDGRDPNGWAGIAWCFGKHDRPWGERPVFGMVRYMNAAGLERKFDMAAYLKQVESFAPQKSGREKKKGFS